MTHPKSKEEVLEVAGKYRLDFLGKNGLQSFLVLSYENGYEKEDNEKNSIVNKGFGHLPICIAKTQYSFSTDPNLKGAPTGHVLPVREVTLSSGAQFIVVVCGSIMTMPGLPKVPAAESIKINNDGEVEGLF